MTQEFKKCKCQPNSLTYPLLYFTQNAFPADELKQTPLTKLVHPDVTLNLSH